MSGKIVEIVTCPGSANLQYFDSMAANLHALNGGITVVAPDGRLVEHVTTPDVHATNICFGGDDASTAYITLSNPRPVGPAALAAAGARGPLLTLAQHRLVVLPHARRRGARGGRAQCRHHRHGKRGKHMIGQRHAAIEQPAGLEVQVAHGFL